MVSIFHVSFFTFSFFSTKFLRGGHANLRVSRDSFHSRSRFFSSPFVVFFSHFIIHYFLTYPYLCDSLWSIIVTTSRMISRRRSASLSLPLPRISWWRIIRTIMKISTLFHPLALSLSFTSRLRSFSVFVFHAFWIVFKGTCIVNYKYRQRDAVAPSSRLFFHHIVVVVAVARRFSFCSFAFFSPFCLNFEQS